MLSDVDCDQAAFQLRNQFQTLKLKLSQDIQIVAGYLPIKNEINPRPLIEDYLLEHKRLVLPKIVEKDTPLHFHQWMYGQPLVVGRYGIEEPLHNSPLLQPDLLLVPMVAFDRNGYRLGHGGGYFDRTITALRKTRLIVCIGLAYAFQEIDDFPQEEHDTKMDYVVTDKEVLAF